MNSHALGGIIHKPVFIDPHISLRLRHNSIFLQETWNESHAFSQVSSSPSEPELSNKPSQGSDSGYGADISLRESLMRSSLATGRRGALICQVQCWIHSMWILLDR